MNDSLLTTLPFWMASFLLLLYPWRIWRQRRLANARVPIPQRAALVTLQKLDWWLTGMLVLAAGIVFLFSYLPQYYRFTLPIDSLDVPLINNFGLVMLRFALFWVVVAQFKIENALRQGLLFHRSDPSFYEAWLKQTIKLLSGGVVVMLVGLFVTISSVAMVVLSLIGIGLYQKHFKLIHR
jgi:hypothetical protein